VFYALEHTPLWNTPSWVQPIFNGSVLIVAVLTARSEARRLRVGSQP